MHLRLRRQIQRAFSRLSRAYARHALRRGERETREILTWVQPRPHEWVLDAACGPGTLARALAPLVARSCGLDLCPRMIRLARGVAPDSSHPAIFTVGDVEALPFPDGTFDLVTCTYSFANFPNPLRVLKELARVTHSGGRIALVDVVAPEDRARCACLNRLEAARSSFYTRILRCSDFRNAFHRAILNVESFRLQRRRRSFHDWLRLSPVRSTPQGTQRLRRMFLESVTEDRASLHPQRVRGDIAFDYTTAWFLLRRP